MAHVELRNICKSFGDSQVVKGVNLEATDKEFVVLVGPSGCGKTTILRMVAGLEDITSGELFFDGKLVNGVKPGDRNVSMVFQDYALYPHMTIFENLAFSMALRKYDKKDINARVQEVADILDLRNLLERRPAQLSGGQRQRVAMGRAIVKRASLFLFDEPLSNLDAKLRAKMRAEIKRFHMRFQTTSIYVTHDQLEAMTLSDKLVVLKGGEVEQKGAPLDVYNNPRSVFVAGFIGSPGMNFVNVSILDKDGKKWIKSEDSHLEFDLPESKASLVKEGERAILGIRPSDIFISRDDDQIPLSWKVPGRIEMVELLGKNAYLSIQLGKYELQSEIMGRELPQVYDTVKVSFNLNHVHLFNPETEMNFSYERSL
jgi:multiple sugar transport system ATP-binding protein